MPHVSCSLTLKYLAIRSSLELKTWSNVVYVTSRVNVKHSSLLVKSNNYSTKRFYSIEVICYNGLVCLESLLIILPFLMMVRVEIIIIALLYCFINLGSRFGATTFGTKTFSITTLCKTIGKCDTHHNDKRF
jgi:hypothetical protein